MAASRSIRGRNWSRSTAFLVVFAVAALVMTASTAMGAVLYQHVNGGSVSAIRAAVSTADGFDTTSTTFTTIPGSSVGVSVASGQSAALIITFSAEVGCSGDSPGYCDAAAYIDGTPVIPGKVSLKDNSDPSRVSAVSFQWVADGVGPGNHTITMRAKVDLGADMQLGKRTLTVLRAKGAPPS
jgi:hypothetical protein